MEVEIRRSKADEARLAVSRCAAELFWRKGVDATSGDAIAAAAGVSKRTVWRYFRSKEACVEPLLLATGLRLVHALKQWPRDVSIEAHLRNSFSDIADDDQVLRDSVSAVRILAMMSREPALRSAWLMACAEAEAQIAPIIAARLGRSAQEFEIKLCAAAVMAAIRVVDEEISSAAVNEGRHFEVSETIDQIAAAMRTASTLPFCDALG